MKTVYDNRQCAHVWASCSQLSGRTATGNLSFEGPTLYSYSTPIGHFLPAVYDRDGCIVCLVNVRSCSMTTSTKHYPAMHAALPISVRKLRVDGINSVMLPGHNGAGGLIASLYETMREQSAAAARPRIRQATRDAELSKLADARDWLRHLAQCDAARRYIPAASRASARAATRATAAEPPACGADRDACEAYARGLNRAEWSRKAREHAANAMRCDLSGDYSGWGAWPQEYLRRESDKALDYARRAGIPAPRGLRAFMRKMAPRIAELDARKRSREITLAQGEWKDSLERAMLARAACNPDEVRYFVAAQMMPAERALYGEPGADDRAAAIRELQAYVKAEFAASEAERAEHEVAAARDMLAAGDYRNAESVAVRAMHRYERAQDASGRDAARDLGDMAHANLAAQFARELAAWRACEPRVTFPRELCDGRRAMLRVKGDTIETSLGAQVPASVAPRVWRAVCAARAGEDVAAAIGMRLGSFRVDAIEPDGTITAGCHVLPFDELARLAAGFGFDPAPDTTEVAA